MSNSNHSHRGYLPLGVSRKREPGSGSEVGFKRPPKRVPPSASNSSAAAKQLADLKRASDNRVLAGYMANEFLTKGTLFGQKYDPARAEAAPVGGEKKAAAGKPKKNPSYAEVANLLKSDGTHIPGIVNPTQLAQWLQM
ncbi:hypothetical protein ACHQM5_014163 [Ranunculus cassubicifolius]